MIGKSLSGVERACVVGVGLMIALGIMVAVGAWTGNPWTVVSEGTIARASLAVLGWAMLCLFTVAILGMRRSRPGACDQSG